MDQRHTTPVSTATVANARVAASAPPSPRAVTMPRINRGAMTPVPWLGFTRGLLHAAMPRDAETTGEQTDPLAPAPAWEMAAWLRRRVLSLMIVFATVLATIVLGNAQPHYEYPLLQWLQTGLFALLFAWVAAGCFTAVMGFVVLLRGDQHAMSKHSADESLPLGPEARTALIMPICNEDVATVFAGLRASCESLAATGAGPLFDVFILSDSNDPAIREAEVSAWRALRDTLSNVNVHYRWRPVRTKRKAGNVADFCRRWGRDYRYMIVLDADSVMSGDCMVTLVRLMETHPTAGILQTAPQACGHATLHARAQQFAARVTGSLFTAGMQYWQLGEAHYWGHNAIIRVEPFMKHCALAPLDGKGALSGDILSHDFVEAALMRRAGYHVWLVHDLQGSYEQQPPNILAELQRDRRWCQGNLQNARLMAEPGLHTVHRGMLATGAMAYLSAPLWLAYVALGALLWLMGGNVFFTPEGELTVGVMSLWAGTLAMLVLPRVLGMLAVLIKGEQYLYGGASRLLLSSVLEAGLSTLQAPLRMVAHTLFVTGALTGWKLEWKSPPREAMDVPWADAAQRFATPCLLTLAIAIALAGAHPPALLWLMPVGLPLLTAIPFIVWTSRAALGEKVRDAGLLLVPEESRSPAVLRRAWAYTSRPGWLCMADVEDVRLAA